MASYLNTNNNSGVAPGLSLNLRLHYKSSVIKDKSVDHLKKGIWIYFFLLIFEGSLRKWILPGLASPLLLIRDPVAIWLLVVAIKKKIFYVNNYILFMTIIGVLSFFSAIFFGHGNLQVAIYGARILLIHFPLMFVIGKVLTKTDVIQIGKTVLWITIPMTILISFQFYSPQSAWVNRGVGGSTEGAGFSGALDYFRPPGTFAFTNGNTLFYSLAVCYLLYFLFNAKQVRWYLIALSTIMILAAIPLSISRTLFFQVCLSIVFTSIAIIHKPAYISKMIIGIGIITACIFILSHAPFFKTAIEALTTRFTIASDSEGGLKGTLGDRFLGGMLGSISKSSVLPFFGYGLGMGTNVGSILISGKAQFLIAEEEWGRIIGELGILFGLGVILIRTSLTFKIAFASYIKMKHGDLLPWILLSFGFILLLQGGWAQPTSLGFCTLTGGLIMASLKKKKIKMPSNHLFSKNNTGLS